MTSPFITENQLPLFTAWLAQNVGSPHDYINVAYEIRNKPIFIDARRKLIELEELLSTSEEKYIINSNLHIGDVEKAITGITTKFGVGTSQGFSLSKIISLWNYSTIFSKFPAIPEIDVRIRKLEALNHLLPQKGFKAIYRTITSDLSQISKLGKYHEIITSKIWLHKEAKAYTAKTEDEKHRKMKSYWKIPM